MLFIPFRELTPDIGKAPRQYDTLRGSREHDAAGLVCEKLAQVLENEIDRKDHADCGRVLARCTADPAAQMQLRDIQLLRGDGPRG